MTQSIISLGTALMRDCLWRIILIVLSKMGKSSPLWVAPFLKQGILNCKWVENTSWVLACINSFFFSLDCGYNVTICFKFLVVMGSNLVFGATWNPPPTNDITMMILTCLDNFSFLVFLLLSWYFTTAVGNEIKALNHWAMGSIYN